MMKGADSRYMDIMSFIRRCEAAFPIEKKKPVQLTSEREYKMVSKEVRLLEDSSWLELDGWFFYKYGDVFFDLDNDTFAYFIPGIMSVSLEPRPELYSDAPVWILFLNLEKIMERIKYPDIEKYSQYNSPLDSFTDEQLKLVREWCGNVVDREGDHYITKQEIDTIFSHLISQTISYDGAHRNID